MKNDKLKNEIFLGVVVDNQDPKKIGRCKIKVFQVFDKLDTEDIPWAMPWKDLNGNEFILPDVGKLVSVVFDQGNKYTPEYIWAQHFNINLENKLNKLSNDDYASMRAVLFDQSTQIYRNQSEGLKIDHEYTNINITPEGNIALNIRDNRSLITIGSPDAQEKAVLGSSFMGWLEELVDKLLGQSGGAFITSDGVPVTASPGLSETLMTFRQRKDEFLSRQVRISRNEQIIEQSREYINQRGDSEFAVVKPGTPPPKSIIVNPNTGQEESYRGYPVEADAGIDSNDASLNAEKVSNEVDPGIVPPSGAAGNPGAMKKAGDALFGRYGGAKGLCAKYTYSIARAYAEIISTGNTEAKLYGGKGHAHWQDYRNNLVKLGYSNPTKQTLTNAELRNIINQTKWNIGDIINYRCLSPVGGNNYANIYGHTQIFTGAVLNGSRGSDWASSFANNYGTGMVYSSGKNSMWECFVLRRL